MCYFSFFERQSGRVERENSASGSLLKFPLLSGLRRAPAVGSRSAWVSQVTGRDPSASAASDAVLCTSAGSWTRQAVEGTLQLTPQCGMWATQRGRFQKLSPKLKVTFIYLPAYLLICLSIDVFI